MRPRRSPTPPRPALVVAVAVLAVLAAVPPALATHNSRGASVHIVQADEVDATGTLDPDVPRGQPYELTFHDDLPVPRPAPTDQSGDRYTTCQTAGEVSPSVYRAGLETGASCYVGFLDAQLEYSFIQGPLDPQFNEDAQYPVNPAPGDEQCQSIENRLNDPACDGSGHEIFRTDEVAVDVDLLEGATGTPAAGATGVAPASGTLTFPVILTEYVFLFGQPHPDNEAPSPLEAGDGPFGPNPAEGGSPISDLSNACGDRTLDCQLLTPTDVKLYDREAPKGIDQPRVCSFMPLDRSFVDQRTDDGECGTQGRPIDAFLPRTRAGGLGVPGAPGTWVGTLPGWHSTGEILLHGGHHGATEGLQASTRDDGQVPAGTPTVYAVNPRVPTPGHPLDCVKPGILAEGDRTVLGLEDPGVFGPYVADAIDLDLYTHPTRPIQRDVRAATYDELRPLIEQARSLTTGDPVDELDLPPALAELLDRGRPLESPAEEPQAQPGPQNARPFEQTLGPGLACNGLGQLKNLETATAVQGGLHLDAVVHGLPGGEDLLESYGLVEAGVPDPAPKDPTRTSEGLPAPESDTEKDGWAPRTYSFQAHAEARLDSNQDGHFEGNCITAASADLQDSPQDTCVWVGIWDAYNPNCHDRDGNTCDEILEDLGYDVHGHGAGVGLYFVLRVTGPTLLTPWTNLFFHESARSVEDRADKARLVGVDDPTAQNCIVGVSIGFTEKLVEHHGEGLLDELCEGSDGERALVENAMFRQFGPDSPPANAALAWTPLMPRPEAGTELTELGQGDRLCMNIVWTVDETGIAEDTVDNIELEPGRNVLTDCDPL